MSASIFAIIFDILYYIKCYIVLCIAITLMITTIADLLAVGASFLAFFWHVRFPIACLSLYVAWKIWCIWKRRRELNTLRVALERAHGELGIQM